MDFVPDVSSNLRHHKIVTSSGRRPALDTSCSLATRAAVTGDVNFPCFICSEGTRRLGLVFSCSATEKPSADHVCRFTSSACGLTSMFWSDTNLVIELGGLVEENRSEFGVAGSALLRETRFCITADVEDRQQNPIVHRALAKPR
jgi:hypothetical protein